MSGVLVSAAAVASIALASQQPGRGLAFVVLVTQPLALVLLALIAWRLRWRHQAVTREYRRRNDAVH
ncbi:MAG: hypothetical protein ACOCXA_07005, partial [Planctomycetota bacterium]